MGETDVRDTTSQNALEISNPTSDNPGQVFLDWVKAGIQSHNLIINDSKAKVNTVDGTVFW